MGMNLGIMIGIGCGNGGGAPPTTKFVGMGNSMKTTVQGFSGGANRSQTVRFPVNSPVAFQKFRVVWQVHWQTGGSLTDTLLPNSLTFQAGIEYPYVLANTGIPPRVPVTKNGQNYADYDTSTWDANYGYVMSDTVDMGSPIPANTQFGIWNTVELPAGTWSNNLPWSINGTNWQERYIGAVGSTSSQIVAKGGASDVAINASSIVHMGTSQSGQTAIMTPAFILIEVALGTLVVGIVGDSISYSIGEGQAGSSTFGDCMGTAKSDSGWIERGLRLLVDGGQPMTWFNLGRGSDGDKNLINPANWIYRKQLLALATGSGIENAKATVINENSKNDNTQPAILTWAATTGYVYGDVINKAGAGIWVCEVPGTSGATGPSGTGPTFVDGTVTWRFIYASNSGTLQTLARSLGQKAKVNKQIKDLMPTCRLVGSTDTPDTSSTDSWTTLANQTVQSGYGSTIDTHRRATLNNWMMTKFPTLLLDACMDPNALVESGWPGSPSGKWAGDEVTANYYPQDGKHPNSRGHATEAPAVTVSAIIGP